MRPELTKGQGDGPLVVAARPDDVLRAVDPGLLTSAERRRGAALHQPADRDAHAAAHLLVRCCAAALSGRALDTLELVQRCPDCGATDHGRPSMADLPEIHVSLAHTRGAVVAGADWRPLGVDVERAHGADVGAAMSVALTAAELGMVRAAKDPSIAFLCLWVRKECLVKLGVATLDSLTGIELRHGTGQDTGDRPRSSRFGDLHLTDWFDRDLDAVVAAAGFLPPVVDSFPPAGRTDARR